MKISKSLRVVLCILLGIMLLIVTVLGGCSPKGEDKTNTTQTSPQGGQSGKEPTTKKPDEISIFYGTAGIAIPEGQSAKDNPYLNKIAEMANVTFKEVTVPEYADFQTKFDLMVSSGNIPDFVHCWQPVTVQREGAKGAFLELSDIIKNSPVLSKIYDNVRLEMMKDEKGKIYALRTLGSKVPMSCVVRADLLDEVNDGIMPVTPDEWYEVFKKLKEKYPDSVPYSARGNL